MNEINENPAFSVIVSNYNYEQFVGQSIESILSQTFENYEIIIVDDGSSDGSRKVIENYRDARITRIYKENGGQASAFNAGFERCRGRYIALLDSDDLFDNDKLERLYSIFSDKEYALVQHQLRIIDGESKKTGRLFPTTLKTGEQDILKLYREKLKTDFFYPTSGLCSPRHILKNVFPLDERQWRICADGPVARPLPIFGFIYTITTPLGSYRIHGDNNWMNTEKRKQTMLDVQKRLNDYTAVFLHKYNEIN